MSTFVFRHLFIVISICVIGDIGATDPVPTEQEGRAFVARYLALNDAFDPSVADLYSDNAQIRALRRHPNGSERSIEMRGTGWKQLIRQTMPLAKARNDRGTLEKLRFEKVEEGLKIRADRYSFMRCYWDRNYFMVIVRENDKVIRVVEEYAETQPQSDC